MLGGGAIRGEARFRVSLKSRGGAYSERCFFCFYFAVLSISCSKLSLSLRAGIVGVSFDSYVFFSFLISTGRIEGAAFPFFSSFLLYPTLGCFILFVVYYFLPLYFYPFLQRIYILTATTTITTATTNALAWCSHAYSFCPFFISSPLVFLFLFLFLFYFGLAGRKIHILFFCAPFLLLFLFFLFWFLLVRWGWLDLRGWVYVSM